MSDAAKGRYAARGINGQTVLIDRSTQTVIAQVSTWPHRMDPHLEALGRQLEADLLSYLSR